jgi:large subunit ribosomal protein L24
MKIHTNDEVIVITGKDKGKKGKVVKANPSSGTVLIEGVNLITRHIKKQGATP